MFLTKIYFLSYWTENSSETSKNIIELVYFYLQVSVPQNIKPQ